MLFQMEQIREAETAVVSAWSGLSGSYGLLAGRHQRALGGVVAVILSPTVTFACQIWPRRPTMLRRRSNSHLADR
jgi:hypothetical protein